MCDSVGVAPARSATGRTLFAKNSDRPEGECQPFVQYPAAHHPRGARVRCTHVEIAQVAETFAVMGHSPFWVFGFEHGVNEHAVAIGNHTVFSREPVEEQPGLIGMDLVRLGLERARTAREAVEVVATLVETHGQGGPAFKPGGGGYHNSFTIADAREVWLMETSGRRWAARRVEAGALTNHFTLDTGWEIASRDLESFARTEGWWTERARVDVARAYRNEHVPGRISEGRLRRSCALLAARAAHDVAGLEALLRDHGDGGLAPPAHTSTEDEAHFTLCMHAEPVGTTTASLVAELPARDERDDAGWRPWPVWISFATPCTGVFLPVYVDGVVPAAYARGGETPSDDSAWWAFARLRAAAQRDFAALNPRLRAAWAPLERDIERERVEAEARALELARAGDGDAARDALSAFAQRCAERAIARAAELVDAIESGEDVAAATAAG